MQIILQVQFLVVVEFFGFLAMKYQAEVSANLPKSNTMKAAARMGLGQDWPHFECKLTPLEQKLMMSCPRSVKQLQA